MTENLFYTYEKSEAHLKLQNWAYPILQDMVIVNRIEELANCFKKVIFICVRDANGHFDLTKQLINQENYLIFTDVREVTITPWYRDLVNDLPEAKKFPCIFAGTVDNVNSINVNTFFFETFTDLNYLKAKHYTIEQYFQNYSKPYKFLYLNGASRHCRNALWHCINNEKLLENALWTYLGYDNDVNPTDIPTKFLDPKYESKNVNLSDCDVYRQEVKDRFEFKKHFRGNVWIDGEIVPRQYIDTYFSVVSETSVVPGKMMITEKLYKPLLAGHPFIVLSSPGTYKFLHELGFKTFSPIIDESFDLEEDLETRIRLITHEIKKLCESNLDEFMLNVREICLYNQEHYKDVYSLEYYKVHTRLVNFIQDSLTAHKQFITIDT